MLPLIGSQSRCSDFRSAFEQQKSGPSRKSIYGMPVRSDHTSSKTPPTEFSSVTVIKIVPLFSSLQQLQLHTLTTSHSINPQQHTKHKWTATDPTNIVKASPHRTTTGLWSRSENSSSTRTSLQCIVAHALLLLLLKFAWTPFS